MHSDDEILVTVDSRSSDGIWENSVDYTTEIVLINPAQSSAHGSNGAELALDGDASTYSETAYNSEAATVDPLGQADHWEAEFQDGTLFVNLVEITNVGSSDNPEWLSNAKVYIGETECGQIEGTTEGDTSYQVRCKRYDVLDEDFFTFISI